ncbi:hypothetical protein BDZ85DRAFT_134727 [Elsinoe ampelina]|uniref:Uncharacterized protein n=1 Tax=Elsinoe ampelina TaxID=302913 RepID=A0A6A6G874_9PEZI|nr:hypothetical protein BDZ85DRAFT_134727 [Elsinoe ampelina]
MADYREKSRPPRITLTALVSPTFHFHSTLHLKMAKRKNKSKRMRIRKRPQQSDQQADQQAAQHAQAIPEAHQPEDATALPSSLPASNSPSYSQTPSRCVMTRDEIIQILDDSDLWSTNMRGCLAGYYDDLYTVLCAFPQGLVIGDIVEQVTPLLAVDNIPIPDNLEEIIRKYLGLIGAHEIQDDHEVEARWFLPQTIGRDIRVGRLLDLATARFNNPPQLLSDGLIYEHPACSLFVVLKRYVPGAPVSVQQHTVNIERAIAMIHHLFGHISRPPLPYQENADVDYQWIDVRLFPTKREDTLRLMLEFDSDVLNILERFNETGRQQQQRQLVTFVQFNYDGGSLNNSSWEELRSWYPFIHFRLLILQDVADDIVHPVRGKGNRWEASQMLSSWFQPLCSHTEMGKGVDHGYFSILDVDVLAQLYPRHSSQGHAEQSSGLVDATLHTLGDVQVRLDIAAKQQDILLKHEQWIYMVEHMYLRVRGSRLARGCPELIHPSKLGSLFESTPSHDKGLRGELAVDVAECLSRNGSHQSKACSWCGQSPERHWSRSLYLHSDYMRNAQLPVCCDRPGCIQLELRLRALLQAELPDLPLDGMVPLPGQYARRPTSIILHRRRAVCSKFETLLKNIVKRPPTLLGMPDEILINIIRQYGCGPDTTPEFTAAIKWAEDVGAITAKDLPLLNHPTEYIPKNKPITLTCKHLRELYLAEFNKEPCFDSIYIPFPLEVFYPWPSALASRVKKVVISPFCSLEIDKSDAAKFLNPHIEDFHNPASNDPNHCPAAAPLWDATCHLDTQLALHTTVAVHFHNHWYNRDSMFDITEVYELDLEVTRVEKLIFMDPDEPWQVDALCTKFRKTLGVENALYILQTILVIKKRRAEIAAMGPAEADAARQADKNTYRAIKKYPN